MAARSTRRFITSCLIASVFAFVACTTATEARSEDIRVLSGGGPQAALRAIIPQFESATGHHVLPTFALVTILQQKLATGEKADLILLPVPLIAATEKSLPLRPEGRLVLARVGIAVIVRTGSTLPDISTPEAVRKLLLDARSVEFSMPDTPVGGHLARMIEQMGIADAVRPKLVIRAAIDGGAQLVADGKVEVAMQLLSEVQSAEGTSVVGLLPPPLQNFVIYGTAIPAYNERPEPAIALVKFLSEPGKKEFWQAAGFELLAADH